MQLLKYIFFLFSLFFIFSCGPEVKNTDDKKDSVKELPTITELAYTVVGEFPHDTTSFTEGFLFKDSVLFESTGSPERLPYTKSGFGTVDLKTGKYTEKVGIDSKKYFGEGIVFLNDKIYQLTYENQIGFVYDAKTYKKIKDFSFTNPEGWGLTTDGKYIIMSDGSSALTYLNPETLKPEKTISVTENGFVADYLNELEYINGFIYANVWKTDNIVKIDPANGKIVAKLNLTDLYERMKLKSNFVGETNGIAFDSINNKIYVTGKLWPSIFCIEFAH